MTEKESVEYVNKYTEVYALIKKIEGMHEYVSIEIGKHNPLIEVEKLVIETIIKIIKESEMITEKDIILQYSKELLTACYDEWEEERKDKADTKELLTRVLKKVFDVASDELKKEEEDE